MSRPKQPPFDPAPFDPESGAGFGEPLLDDPSGRSDRFESLGRLAGGIAHDLNNILTGILGHVSYLRLSNTVPAGQWDSLRAIEDGARRAAAMTQQIVGFARGETGEMCSVDLSQVVYAGVNLLKGIIPPNVKLVADQLPRDIWVHGDESQISQLVLNLAVNARDALPNGGVIEISIVPFVTASSIAIEHSDGTPAGSLQAGRYAQLTITDNGIGIPATVRHRIFEPFFTTKSRRGTGLGLANVVSIVRAHGGLIRLQTVEGQGTRFDVFLPAAGDADQPVAQSQQEPPVVPQGKEKILVVDDEETVRMVMQRCLEHLGYEVQVAASGAEALSLYAEDMIGFRLVILDMMMPQMSGDEVFTRLKELNDSVAVLIASGFASDARTRRVLDGGGLGFIQKPFAVDDLAREVRRCLDSSL